MKQKLFKLTVFSRHPSHNTLRQNRVMLPVRTSVRFGSTNMGTSKYKVELNKPEGVRISSNKLLMKQKFTEAGIKTPDWWIYSNNSFIKQIRDKTQIVCKIESLPYPIIAKNVFGSRGTGNYKLNSIEELTRFITNKDLTNYIFERYYDYAREYRLHISALGCFYTCRKMLKTDTTSDKKWFRNDSNSVWIMEENVLFDKPITWGLIIANCVNALKAVGLDFAAFDVKVMSKEPNDWIVIESNSAPSFGSVTLQKYTEHIPILVNYMLENK